MTIKKYKLLKDLPRLKAGAIFEHRRYDKEHPDRGNMACGCLILGWLNHNAQQGWCADTYIFPGQLAENREWFEPIEEKSKDPITQYSEELAETIKNFNKSIKKDISKISKKFKALSKLMEEHV